MENYIISSGRSHPKLAEMISSNLGLHYICKQNIVTFKNGEIGVTIDENVRNRDVFLVQSGWSNHEEHFSVNDMLMETLILVDAYKRSAARSITLVIPHYPYARQDKKDESRAPISAKLVGNIFEKAGVSRVVVMDLHAPQIQGFFDIPVDNIYSLSIFKDYFKEIKEPGKKYVIISPDAGGMKRAMKFGKIFKVPVTMMYKQRDYSKISTITSMEVIGTRDTLEGRIAIICDDICDSGGTLEKCIERLEDYGVDEVWCFIAHGIFSEPAMERMNNCSILKKLVVLNTIPQEHNMKQCDKLTVLDCSYLLSNVIKCLITGDSISSLFQTVASPLSNIRKEYTNDITHHLE